MEGKKENIYVNITICVYIFISLLFEMVEPRNWNVSC